MLSLVVILTVLGAVNARTQSGFCGENGFDGISGTVPACAFSAGGLVNGVNTPEFEYQLPIEGITSCDQCKSSSEIGPGAFIYDCTLFECNDAGPYEPCSYATC